MNGLMGSLFGGNNLGASYVGNPRGMSASATPLNPFEHQGTYAMKNGGLDVMGTFEKQNREIDFNRRNPGANPMNYGGM